MWNPFKKTSPENGRDHCWHNDPRSSRWIECCYCGEYWWPGMRKKEPLPEHGDKYYIYVPVPKPTGKCPKR